MEVYKVFLKGHEDGGVYFTCKHYPGIMSKITF